MRIGFIIACIGGVDGVALETEKWIEVLKKLGHEIYTISGQFLERKMDPQFETLVPEMSFNSPESYWSQKKAFFYPECSPDELIDHINFYSRIIYNKIISWAHKKKIDLLISENASSLPSHLEMGIAIKKAATKLGIPVITHDHDFSWERGERFYSPHDEINKFVDTIFPLRLPNSIHAVINSYAKNSLKYRFGRDAEVVPNVMDFNKKFGQQNEKNNSLHENLGYDSKKDLLLFQVTRIMNRKSIETAINLVHKLHNRNIKLVITGNAVNDEDDQYYSKLISLIHDLKLNNQVRFASDLFHHNGHSGNNHTETRFSRSDAYAQATACTYFSHYESFGNAFIEAVLAKKPIFVNNYKPVYWTDIGSKGFQAVMLEDNELSSEKVNEMKDVINNKNLAYEIGEHNYALGKKFFSFNTLEEKLLLLLEKAVSLV